jgi:anaerobic ribonucleoside-triphosphate reductase
MATKTDYCEICGDDTNEPIMYMGENLKKTVCRQCSSTKKKIWKHMNCMICGNKATRTTGSDEINHVAICQRKTCRWNSARYFVIHNEFPEKLTVEDRIYFNIN